VNTPVAADSLGWGVMYAWAAAFITWFLLRLAGFGEMVFDFDVCAGIAAVMLLCNIVIGLPSAFLLSGRCLTAWEYALAGAVVGLVPLLLFTMALEGSSYEDYLDREGMPASAFTLAWAFIEVVFRSLFTTSSGLVCILPGAAGGLGYWLARRGWVRNRSMAP
jgi:hypothetical protein